MGSQYSSLVKKPNEKFSHDDFVKLCQYEENCIHIEEDAIVEENEKKKQKYRELLKKIRNKFASYANYNLHISHYPKLQSTIKYQCFGRKKIACKYCSGLGTAICNECEGTCIGYYFSFCPKCVDGWIPCSFCKGSGEEYYRHKLGEV